MKRVIIMVVCVCLVAVNVMLPMQPAHAFAAESAIIYGLVSGLLSLGTGMATSSSYNMQVIDAIRNSGQNFIDDFKAWPFTVAGSVLTGAALIESLATNNIVDGKLQVGKGVLQAVSGWLSNFSKNNEFQNINASTSYVINSSNSIPKYYPYENSLLGHTTTRLGSDAEKNIEFSYYYDIYPLYARTVLTNDDYELYYLYKLVIDQNYGTNQNFVSDNTGANTAYICKQNVAYPTTGNSVAYRNGVQFRSNSLISLECLYNNTSSPYEINSYRGWAGITYAGDLTYTGEKIHLMPFSSTGLAESVDYTDSGKVWQTWDEFESDNEQQTSDLVIAAPLPNSDDTDVYTALQALLAQGVSGVDAISQALVNVLKGAIAETTEAVNAGTGEIVDALTNTATLEMDMNKMSIPALIVTKFPFCIPFDLYNAFNTFAAAGSTPPEFNLPLTYNGTTANINIKFSQFQVWANIVRWGVLISFNVGLIVITRKLIKG